MPTNLSIDGDAGIQFEAQQKNKGIDLNPNHHDDKSSDGAIDLVVSAEIIDKIGETDR